MRTSSSNLSTAHPPDDSLRTLGRLSNTAMRRFTGRFGDQPAWAVVTEVFIGLGWARAAASKVIDSSWWTGDYLSSFLVEHEASSLDWYTPFLDAFVAPNVAWVSVLVLVLQIGVAASLLSGKARAVSLGAAITMNLHFLAAGAVNPSAFYLLAQGGLVLWLIDRWSAADRRALLPSVAAAGMAMAGFNVAFIGTVHPAEVIDDPAIMFITVGMLTCLGSIVSLANDASSFSAEERASITS